MPSTRSSALLGLVCLAVVVVACSAGLRSAPQSSLTAGASSDPVSGLPVVGLADLPPEVAETLALIDADGPFPNRQYGATFQNRESILPRRPKGYYHEYTVPTPGSTDRGVRRIITGADGELYWTADHYDSFSWIAR